MSLYGVAVALMLLFGGYIAPIAEVKLGVGSTSYAEFISNAGLPEQCASIKNASLMRTTLLLIQSPYFCSCSVKRGPDSGIIHWRSSRSAYSTGSCGSCERANEGARDVLVLPGRGLFAMRCLPRRAFERVPAVLRRWPRNVHKLPVDWESACARNGRATATTVRRQPLQLIDESSYGEFPYLIRHEHYLSMRLTNCHKSVT